MSEITARLKTALADRLRQKSDYQLWFTFFHEAAHILLHPKRKVFLEQSQDGDELEHEADEFASNHLIPSGAYRTFVEGADFDVTSIRAFAATMGVSAGVVVGRLQYDEQVPYKSRLSRLKKRYMFTEE